jgi:hypothetical protein
MNNNKNSDFFEISATIGGWILFLIIVLAGIISGIG